MPTHSVAAKPLPPNGRVEGTLWEKLCRRFTMSNVGGCWEWIGHIRRDGYGKFHYTRGEKSIDGVAHRLVYEHLVGEIPKGLVLDHLCRNRRCVNPKHLEPVTSAENCRRGVYPVAEKPQCLRGHQLSDENVYRSPTKPNHRRCRACILLRNRDYYSAKKARQAVKYTYAS